MHRQLTRAALAFALLAPLAAGPAPAQGLIRDAEIEDTLDRWVTPLVEGAGFKREEIRFHIVRSPAINAFVSGGKRVFLTTGLLMESADPTQVQGVVAHELGHITGGHLVRMSAAAQDAWLVGALGTVLGVAGGVASGGADAVLAGILVGQDIAERSFTSFTRVQERSADQVAVELLDKAGIPADGLLALMEELDSQQLLARSRQDPYLQTHPATRDRIRFVKEHIATSPTRPAGPRPPDLAAHGRLVAKLRGFIDRPRRTLRAYRMGDARVPARYGRAIALYRSGRIDEALGLVDGLIAGAPEDPYFHELRGQILFENGRLDEARGSYETALRLLPGQPLVAVGLAHVYLELGDPELTREASRILDQAIVEDRMMVSAWRLAAIARGRSGELGLSALASAEHAVLVGRLQDAAASARKALRLLPEGAPARLRARDILSHTDPAAAEGAEGAEGPGGGRGSGPARWAGAGPASAVGLP